MFCKHVWKVISETTTKSKLELAKGLNVDFKSGNPNFIVEMTKRKYIQILSCSECGKLKRFQEDI